MSQDSMSRKDGGIEKDASLMSNEIGEKNPFLQKINKNSQCPYQHSLQ